MKRKHKHLIVIGRAFEGEDFAYRFTNKTPAQAIKEFNKEVEDLYNDKDRETIIEAVLTSNSKIEFVHSDTMVV